MGALALGRKRAFLEDSNEGMQEGLFLKMGILKGMDCFPGNFTKHMR